MRITHLLLLSSILVSGCATSRKNSDVEPGIGCSFDQAPASIVLEAYAHACGKEVLVRAGVHGRMTLEAKELTQEGYLALLEKRLGRAGIILVPDGKNRLIAEWKDPEQSGMRAVAAEISEGPTKPSTPTK